MEGLLSSTVSIGDVGTWICIAIIVLFILSKLADMFVPGYKEKILRQKKMEDNDTDHEDRIKKLEEMVKEMDKKVNCDYYKINEIERQTKDSLEERAILMRSTLAILKGLQEIGANGPTKVAQEEIEQYLTRKAHEV